jgi:hypothetical protein
VFVTLAYHAAQENRADEAQALAERALAFDPYPPPFQICRHLIITIALIECYDAPQRLCEDLLGAARQRGAVHEVAAILPQRPTRARAAQARLLAINHGRHDRLSINQGAFDEQHNQASPRVPEHSDLADAAPSHDR